MRKIICSCIVIMCIVLLVSQRLIDFKNLMKVEPQDFKNTISQVEEKEKPNSTINNDNEGDKKVDLDKNNVSKSDILLVNKTTILTQQYIPKNLKIPKVRFIFNVDPNVKRMEANAADALERLFNAALKDDIFIEAVSGYRTYKYQEKLYNDKVETDGEVEADKYIAKPGESEHQTGLAMDVLSDEYTSLDEGFTNTKAYKWIKKNCYKYGFIIRYAKEKENITKYSFEPWHLRYVGILAAREITENDLALEEYVNNKN